MTENQPKQGKRGRNFTLFILLVLAAACCGLYTLSNGLSASNAAISSNRPASAAGRAIATARPTATLVTFAPIRLNGRGDDVVRLSKPDVPAVVHLTHQGSSNFIVTSYDSDGARIDLLVNEIGRYDGVRPLDFALNEWTERLEIQADGAWTAVIEPITAATAVAVPNGGYNGRGDAVLLLTGGDPDTATLSHSGTSNFVVQAYGSTRHLLVNEIGVYNGTVIVPRDTVVLEVVADGSWRLAITGR